MKRYLQLFIILLVSTLVVLSGCDLLGGDDTTDDTDDALAVGEASPDVDGYTVTYVDEAGGYFAEKDDDDTQVLVWGRFEEDIDFTNDKTWILGNAVFIGNNAQDPDNAAGNKLTIEEGTLIKGEVDPDVPGALIITRGSDISAVGTASSPIIFTSLNPTGSRAAGDWGGIIINGYARVQGGGGYKEGEGGTGQYGGGTGDFLNDADNSGTLKYVVVQFAGTLFSADNELNGIAFQGVGSGTTVEYIQVHRNADDGIEFFGGSVQVKYYVGTGNQDDSLDGDDAWNGSAQHVILQHYDDDAGSLIEADGDAEEAGFPPANAYLANITAIGSTASSNGFNFKSDADYDVFNSLVAMPAAAGVPVVLDVDPDDGTTPIATIDYAGTLAVSAPDSAFTDVADLSTGFDLTQDFPSDGSNNTTRSKAITDANLASGAIASKGTDVWSFAFNFQPTAGTSVTITDADSNTTGIQDPAGNTMDDTNYIGAYDGTDAWWDGWTSFPID